MGVRGRGCACLMSHKGQEFFLLTMWLEEEMLGALRGVFIPHACMYGLLQLSGDGQGRDC